MEEDVAEPDEISVDQSDNDQPCTSPVEDRSDRRATPVGTIHHQDNAGAIEH
jgi:hypothetical protein